jgi:hypothetical protein
MTYSYLLCAHVNCDPDQRQATECQACSVCANRPITVVHVPVLFTRQPTRPPRSYITTRVESGVFTRPSKRPGQPQWVASGIPVAIPSIIPRQGSRTTTSSRTIRSGSILGDNSSQVLGWDRKSSPPPSSIYGQHPSRMVLSYDFV